MRLILTLLLIFFLNCSKKEEPAPVVSPSPAAPEPPKEEVKAPEFPKIKVNLVMGDVLIERNGVKAKPKKDDILEQEDGIQTGKTGMLEILIGESTALKISKNTKFQISQIATTDKEAATNINLTYGKLLALVEKKKKDGELNVITPTSLAGVRGTLFYTEVKSKDDSQKNCETDTCLTKFIVLDGTIAVKKPGKSDEIYVEKNSRVTISNKTELKQNLVKPVNHKSLESMKEMLVTHKNQFMGFTRLLDELKEASPELLKLESSNIQETEKKLTKKEATKNKADEVIKTAKKIDEEKFIEKEIHKDKLKIEPNPE